MSGGGREGGWEGGGQGGGGERGREGEQRLEKIRTESLLFVCSRTFYQFEAAWDSSLHNSVLLNRFVLTHITPVKYGMSHF